MSNKQPRKGDFKQPGNPGQFAGLQPKTEAGLDLMDVNDTGLPTEVVCPHCAGDPDSKGMTACHYCDNGMVTVDRFGQLPWGVKVPGTKVAFEVMRGDTPGWQIATVTASNRTGSHVPNYGMVLTGPTGAEAHEVAYRKMIPVPASWAAAAHNINGDELANEAAARLEASKPGVRATHEEVMACLIRVDGETLNDMAEAASRFRTDLAAKLRAEGRTGPALDATFDTSTLPAGSLDRAIASAHDAFPSMTRVVGRDHWYGHTITVHEDGRLATYKDTAWDQPEETSVLPWSPPTGTPIAHVALDGTVTRADKQS
jgi:hypothetical protein